VLQEELGSTCWYKIHLRAAVYCSYVGKKGNLYGLYFLVICNWYFRVSANFLLVFFITMHMSLFKSHYCYVTYCQVGNQLIIAFKYRMCLFGDRILLRWEVCISCLQNHVCWAGSVPVDRHIMHCEGFPCS